MTRNDDDKLFEDPNQGYRFEEEEGGDQQPATPQPVGNAQHAECDLRDPGTDSARDEMRKQHPDHARCAHSHQRPSYHTNRDCLKQRWRHRYPLTPDYLQSRRGLSECRARQAPRQSTTIPYQQLKQVVRLQESMINQLQGGMVQQRHEQAAKRAKLGNLLPGAAERQALVATNPSSIAAMPFARGEMPSFLASGSGNLIHVTNVFNQAPIPQNYGMHPTARLGPFGWSGGADVSGL